MIRKILVPFFFGSILFLTFSCSFKKDDTFLVIGKTKEGDYFNKQLFGYFYKGEVVIEPKYEEASFFNPRTGLAFVKNVENELYGYINKKGQYVIEPKFEEARMHSEEGLARVKEDSNWGFIDKEGKYVIPNNFELAGAFSEGLAPVKFGVKYGYIDTEGRLTIQPEFTYWKLDDLFFYESVDFNSLYKFNNNRAGIRIKNKFGFIDKSGRLIIEPQFDVISNFHKGKAKVAKCMNCELNETRKVTEMKLLWGIIDTMGNFLIEPNLIAISSSSSEPFPVAIEETEKSESRSSNKNKSFDFRVLIPGYKKYKLGYMDFGGNWVIPPRFEYIKGDDINRHIFSEGLAFVCENDTCGYINMKGEYVLERKYFKTGSFVANEFFREGLAAVSINSRSSEVLSYSNNFRTGEQTIRRKNLNYIGFINKKGDFVIPPKFRTVTPFNNGYSMVTNYQDCVVEKSCYIDTTGNYVWYDENSKSDFKIIDE